MKGAEEVKPNLVGGWIVAGGKNCRWVGVGFGSNVLHFCPGMSGVSTSDSGTGRFRYWPKLGRWNRE
jgi:hypothetical protein